MGCFLSAVDRDTWPYQKNSCSCFLRGLQRPDIWKHLAGVFVSHFLGFVHPRVRWTKSGLVRCGTTDKWPARASRASPLLPCVGFPVASGNNSCLKIALPPGLAPTISELKGLEAAAYIDFVWRKLHPMVGGFKWAGLHFLYMWTVSM